jgi:colanic acid/amylovoran biosynthesis glycosyltransferase
MLIALHSHPVWLPLTQTWMYNAVKHLPPSQIVAHVVCETVEHSDRFPVSHLHALCAEPALVSGWDRAVRSLRLRRHLRFVERVARRQRAHLLHSHFGHVAWANRGAARNAGLRHVASFYGFDVGKIPRAVPKWRQRYAQLFSEVDLVLCEGPHMRSNLSDLGCPEDRLHLHRLGVELDRLPYRPRQWDTRAPLRLLLASSFRQKKGIPDALEAAARLRKHLALEITIVGDAGPDRASAEEKRRIQASIARHALHDCVRLLGYQPHERVVQEALAHHVFLAPSVTADDGDTEGGAPVIIAEMMATGMPVIGTRHCDIPEVLGPDLEHLLVDQGSPQQLADCIGRLADQSGTWSTLAQHSRGRIERLYDARQQGVALAQLYERVCA